MVKPTRSVIEAIRKHAVEVFPNEACGLLVKRGKRTVVVPCGNIDEKPTDHFTIDPDDYVAAADSGEVIGIYHSHPNRGSKPSDHDIASCNLHELPWFVQGLHQADGEWVFDEPAVIEPVNVPLDYVGRPYVFGIYDCYTLVRDYYQREFDITLGEYPRIEGFWKKGLNFFVDGYPEQGFRRLIDEQPQVGDLFILQIDSDVPNHIAVYIGNDQILHHCVGRLSRRDVFGGFWMKHVTHHIRHESKC